MNERTLRNWMQRAPQPVRLRTDAGDVIMLEGRHKWQEAITSIDALEPDLLEALSKDGAVIRTLRVSGTTGEAKERKVEDPTVALSRVMMEVADRAAERHQAAYDKAFEALLGITKMVNSRLATMERAYMALVTRHAQAIEENAGQEDGELNQMVTGLVLKSFLEGDTSETGEGQKKAG